MGHRILFMRLAALALVLAGAAAVVVGAFAALSSAASAPVASAYTPLAVTPEPGTIQSFSWGSGADVHPYDVYTPSGYTLGSHPALIVMLHGCGTLVSEQIGASNYDPLADQDGFVMLYPEVDHTEATFPDGNVYCWDIFNPKDWERGRDDSGAVAAMTRLVMARWGINPERVYLIGMSSGAYLAGDMAGDYPDLYAAVGQDAGGGFADPDCVAGLHSHLTVSKSAEEAYAAEGPRARVVPRFVIGGNDDTSVPAACATKSLLQGLRTDNLVVDHKQTGPIKLKPAAVVAEPNPGGYRYTVSAYEDQYGCVVGERYLVDGLDHAWSGGAGGYPWTNWSDPKGPSAALASWNFFSQFTLANTRHPCR